MHDEAFLSVDTSVLRTFNAKHWLVVIVGCLLNFFAFSHLTCSRVKETIFIQKQEQPALKLAYCGHHWDAIWATGLKDETEKLEFR
ncbi:hypothetical protein T4B_4387 [Trichinella pseudospiralis]|uniref:Uncharacterized protein n=1 Tax=Trichinella pseudospiralis TaxID=6337 RepID=A0A0V1J3R2_TRIPS|nr:hypothetical protein T4B_4387 [Trichinella pseudospiralis]